MVRIKKMAAILLAAGLALSAAACGKGQQDSAAQEGNAAGYKDDVAVADIQAAVAQKLGDNYWPDMDVPAELLEDTYGIKEEMYEEILAQTPMISANVDTLVIVKAKEGSEKQVEDALLAYKEYNTTQALQYPMNLGKVQAAQVAVYGRYVCFVQLGAETPESDEDGDGAAIKHCEQENAKALEAIEEILTK